MPCLTGDRMTIVDKKEKCRDMFPEKPDIGFRMDVQMEIDRNERRLVGLENFINLKARSQDEIDWAIRKIEETRNILHVLKLKLDALKKPCSDGEKKICCICNKEFETHNGFCYACREGVICYNCMFFTL